MTEQAYDFRKRLTAVHKKNRRISKPMGDGQIEITKAWRIAMPSDSVFLKNIALDLKDYFAVSMGVTLEMTDEPCECCIMYETDATMEENAYRIVTSSTNIRLIGRDERMAAKASYLLEDLLNLEEAPYLSVGTVNRRSFLRCRMVHSGYAEDEYPDEYLNTVAHSGMTAIMVFVSSINHTPTHELDFNDLIVRAARYGLDVYAYSYMESRKHPEDPGAEEYYDELYGKLFRTCPGFKGVIFVGERIEFPSKDERSSGMLRLDNRDAKGRPLVDKPNPGWFPCRDYPEWLNMVKKIIRREKSDADIVFWTYNWGFQPQKERVELIENLPTDISIQATFEMFEIEERQGVRTGASDYTLVFPNAGKYFLSEAEAAKKKGIPLYSMTNAAGRTWDCGVVPYLPMPYLWLKRYESIRACYEKYGLCGSMEGHHYGFTPSFISDLAKQYFDSEAPDGEAIIRRLIVRDWGEQNADIVEQAYRLMSDGLGDMTVGSRDQYGPLRIGPAYPLVLFRDVAIKLPKKEGAHMSGNSICNPNYSPKIPITTEEEYTNFEGEIRVLRSCAERILRGASLLRGALPLVSENKREDAKRMAGLAEFLGRTVLTTYHLRCWYLKKFALINNVGDRSENLKCLSEIGKLEIENAKATLPLVDYDSHLGFEPAMDYMGTREQIEWKLTVMDRILNEEIPELEQSNLKTV